MFKGFGFNNYLKYITSYGNERLDFHERGGYLYQMVTNCINNNQCPCEYLELAKPYINIDSYDAVFKINIYTDRNHVGLQDLIIFLNKMYQANIYIILTTLIKTNYGLVVLISLGDISTKGLLTTQFQDFMQSIRVNYCTIAKIDTIMLLGEEFLFPITKEDYELRYSIIKNVNCINSSHIESYSIRDEISDKFHNDSIQYINNLVIVTASNYLNKLNFKKVNYYHNYYFACFIPVYNCDLQLASYDFIKLLLNNSNVEPVSLHKHGNIIYILVQYTKNSITKTASDNTSINNTFIFHDSMTIHKLLAKYKINSYNYGIINEIIIGPVKTKLKGLPVDRVISEIELLSNS